MNIKASEYFSDNHSNLKVMEEKSNDQKSMKLKQTQKFKNESNLKNQSSEGGK